MAGKHPKVIIIAIIGHIHPDRVIEFEDLLNSLHYFRVIRREISSDKLWIQKR